MIVLPAPGSSASRKRMRGSLQEVVVDRLELVRQRIDAGDGEREVGVVLVGQAQPQGFDQGGNVSASPSKGSCLGRDFELRELAAELRTARELARSSVPCRSSLTDAPIGTTTSTCTGSGKIGPRTMTFGFRLFACIRLCRSPIGVASPPASTQRLCSVSPSPSPVEP